MIRKNGRNTVRRLIKAKKNESIESALNRHKVKAKKIIFRKKVTPLDLENLLKDLGIKEGDNLMVHASWRDLYNFDGSPQDVIGLLEKAIGKEGTLLMPSYGKDRTFFDVDNTPSSAGVLSEVFRQQSNTLRSHCTHFSVSARGKNAENLITNHFYSEYGFDQNSPYYLLSKLENSKVLFLGLGKEPTQISIFHCAGYLLKNELEVYKRLLSNYYKAILIKDGILFEKQMVIRQPGHGNNKKVFKKIFRSLKLKKQVKISNIDIVVIDAQEAVSKAVFFAKKEQYCYKNMKKI